jgi:hypothetical protein
MSRIDAIKARLAAATPGPWKARTTGVAGGDHWYVCDKDQSIASIHASDGEDEAQREPDAEFIANAPTDVAHLLNEEATLYGMVWWLAHNLSNKSDSSASEWVAAAERNHQSGTNRSPRSAKVVAK